MESFTSSRSVRNTQNFFQRHRVGTSVVAILFVLYYWNAIRPARISNHCMDQSSVNAKVLLENKAEVETDPEQKRSYENLVEKGMYLRSDYESYYKKCLRGYGIFI